jgi:hypothetical protein
LAERVEEPEEAVKGVAIDTTADERGDLRLIQSEQFGGFRLREATPR